MKLSEVLDRKGHAVVETADAATIREAARTMCENHVGCIVVVNLNEETVGILTERDIMRHFAGEESGLGDRKVTEIMSRDVVTASPDMTLDDALSMMSQRRFRRLPVVKSDGQIDGLVTMGDLVRAMLAEKAEEADTLRNYIAS